MSCDRDRDKWWDSWKKWFKNHFPEESRKILTEMLDNYIQSKMDEATKGGTGRRRSSRRKSNEKTTRKKREKITSTASPIKKPSREPKPPTRIKPTNPPAQIYDKVKDAAVKREFDYTPEERDEIAWKTRMLRRWIRITDDMSLKADPAHGSKSDLPKISSQVAYAAVFDWMVEAKFSDLISPFDSAYKAIWRDKNSCSEQEKIELHKQVEEIDIKVHRKKLPLLDGEQQVKEIIVRLQSC